MANPQSLIEKIKALPPERLDEVEDFVDFIALRDQERSLARVAAATSEAAFAKIWSNPDDDAYDALLCIGPVNSQSLERCWRETKAQGAGRVLWTGQRSNGA